MALESKDFVEPAPASSKFLTKFEDFNQDESSKLSANEFDRPQNLLNSSQHLSNSNSYLNSLINNDLSQSMDSGLLQKMQLLQQQQQNTALYQQLQKQKLQNQMSHPQATQQYNQHQQNKSLNQQSLNDIQLKLHHQIQFQQQLQTQMNQLKLQQQSQLANSLVKQQLQQIVQQIQYQLQVNANSILNLINSRNAILQQQQQQQQQQLSNQLNRKTPVHLDNLGAVQSQVN